MKSNLWNTNLAKGDIQELKKVNLHRLLQVDAYQNTVIQFHLNWAISDTGKVNLDFIKYAVEKRVNIHNVNSDGFTALCQAVRFSDTFFYLVEMGANINYINPLSDISVFHYSIAIRNKKVTRYLLKNADNVFYINKRKFNAFYWAVKKKHLVNEIINSANIKKEKILTTSLFELDYDEYISNYIEGIIENIKITKDFKYIKYIKNAENYFDLPLVKASKIDLY